MSIFIPEMLSKLPSNEWKDGRWYYDPYEILRAAVQYLGEPCYEHPIGDYEHDCKSEHVAFVDSQVDDYYHWHYAHRKDCPDCMSTIRKELEAK